MNLIQQLYNESEQRDTSMRTMLASWIKANASPFKRGANLPIPSPVKEWLADELVARIAYNPDRGEDFSNSAGEESNG